jgi:hypothetical protein
MPAAPQLIARLTQVTLKNAVDYSSILLPDTAVLQFQNGDAGDRQWPNFKPLTGAQPYRLPRS